MESVPDRKALREERLAFVRQYAAWVKETPNREWSRSQAILIDSLIINARNMPLSPRVYRERVTRRRKERPVPVSRESESGR